MLRTGQRVTPPAPGTDIGCGAAMFLSMPGAAPVLSGKHSGIVVIARG